MHKLALTSPTSGGRSVDIARSRTQAMELVKRKESGWSYTILPPTAGWSSLPIETRAGATWFPTLSRPSE
jgi:hypothetical protein